MTEQPSASVTLRDDYRISPIIKGGWQLAGDHGSVEQARAIDDMLLFFDAGITAFDCADIYTGVEEMLGAFLSKLSQQRGVAAARQVHIHTKYVPDITQLSHLKKNDVSTIIDRSLKRLGVERLDLVQFHWWDYNVGGCLQAALWLDELREAGKIAHIGITNFDAEHLAKLCAQQPILSAQVQYSLLDRRAATAFATVAQQHNVHIFAYGVLAGGFLSNQWLDVADPGFEFANRSLVKYRLIIEEFGGWQPFQKLLQALNTLAQHYQVDIDTIAINAMLQQSDISALIIGARYANRLSKTLRAFNFKLSKTEIENLQTLIQAAPGPNGAVFGLERDKSGVHGRIMKYNLNQGDHTQMQQTQDASTQ